MAIDIRTVQATAVYPTGTTQDVDISGFGTVAGVRFRWVNAWQSTKRSHSVYGVGYASFESSTRQWFATSYSKDNVATTVCKAAGSQSACIGFWEFSTDGIDLTGSVTRHADGITITWTKDPPLPWMFEVTLYGGADLMCEAGTEIDNNDTASTEVTLTAVDMTEEPEWIEFAAPQTNAFSTTPTSDATFTSGYGRGPTASIAQASVGYNDEDGQASTGQIAVQASDTRRGFAAAQHLGV